MKNSVAFIRAPTDDELRKMRDLWSALKQSSLPASTDIGVELQTYLRHAVRMVGVVAALNPVSRNYAVIGMFLVSR